MKEGPHIAPVAALIGDPARANMLAALLAGKALTAGELAREAGVSAPTASSHLSKLAGGGLVSVVAQGRHRYFRLSGADVAEMLEKMMGVAARAGHLRTRTGPKAPALRKARVCYDHLAGEMGVAMLERLVAQRLVTGGDVPRLTERGEVAMAKLGIDVTRLKGERRAVCKPCLDWSMRRHHLAGGLGAALLERFFALRWARRDRASRAVVFSPQGERAFERLFVL
ncbi:MAG: helix-turn-helix transcriptional regulator [Alphaproteobacteria bacterium]|nr:helix-turn-helix transcriptional regulator [Alphaproteobacteria bacterium]